jgi:hypothetical protein
MLTLIFHLIDRKLVIKGSCDQEVMVEVDFGTIIN